MSMSNDSSSIMVGGYHIGGNMAVVDDQCIASWGTHQTCRVYAATYGAFDVEVLDGGILCMHERSNASSIASIDIYGQCMAVAVKCAAVGNITTVASRIDRRDIGTHDGIDLPVSAGILHQLYEGVPVVAVVDDELSYLRPS